MILQKVAEIGAIDPMERRIWSYQKLFEPFQKWYVFSLISALKWTWIEIHSRKKYWGNTVTMYAREVISSVQCRIAFNYVVVGVPTLAF